MAVVENTSVVVPALQAMILDVKEGKWCRDRTNDSQGHYCALGLTYKQCRDLNYWRDPSYIGTMEALDRAIPVGALDGPRGEFGKKVNGGTSRGRGGAYSRVASFNNTVRDQSEIIQWFERAMKEEK